MESQDQLSTEQAILEAAEALFLMQGYARTSTTQIARRAGCNQALVHYYFRTKAQLFDRIFTGKLQSFVAEFLGAYSQGTTFERRICGIVDAHYRILARNPLLPALIIGELAADPERIESVKTGAGPLPAELFGRLEADLEDEIAAGRVRPMQARELLLDILSLDAFPFLAAPLLKRLPGIAGESPEKFYAARCEAVKRTLINSLKP